MDTTRVAVRALDGDSVRDAAALHMEAFPSFFLTFLGKAFLTEFYEAFVCEPTAIAFVARNSSGRLCGIVVGTSLPEGFFRRLLIRRWWAFGFSAAGALVRNPRIVRRLFRAVRYRGDAPKGAQRALLSSIAVSPVVQGRGVGRLLAERWLVEARRRGCHGGFLITDRDNNDSVNAFYRRLGWRLESVCTTPEGRALNRYVIDFECAP